MEVRGNRTTGQVRFRDAPTSRSAPLLCGSGLGACEENPGLRATLLELPSIAAMAEELRGGVRGSGAIGGNLRGRNPGRPLRPGGDVQPVAGFDAIPAQRLTQ